MTGSPTDIAGLIGLAGGFSSKTNAAGLAAMAYADLMPEAYADLHAGHVSSHRALAARQAVTRAVDNEAVTQLLAILGAVVWCVWLVGICVPRAARSGQPIQDMDPLGLIRSGLLVWGSTREAYRRGFGGPEVASPPLIPIEMDRVVGLDGVRVDIAMMRTPDGHGRLELTSSTDGGQR